MKSLLRKCINILKSQTFVNQSLDPYSTHIPVLVGLSFIYNFKNITEYGSGLNSTPLFLNKDIFPSVIKMLSFENYEEWYEKVKLEINSPNLDYRYVDGPMCNFVTMDDVAKADLVFIDDSYTAAGRARTIDAVLSFAPSVCLIHDFENFPYRLSCFKAGKKYYRFKGILPNIGIVGHVVDFDLCQKIDNIIYTYSSSVKNNDVKAWCNIFKGELL